MFSKEYLLSYFKSSVRKDNQNISPDMAYTFTDEDILKIMEVSLTTLSPEYELNNVPKDLVYFLVILAKKEVYYRLATVSAPLYPIEAEGASLRKDYRFEHYMSLIRRLEQDFNSQWQKYNEEKGIQVVSVFIDSYHYRHRNYSMANTPTVDIIQCIPHEEYVNLEWTKFKVFAGLFESYKIYLATELIYDEFEDSINPNAKLIAEIRDIHHTKFKVKGLTADKIYNILLVSEDRNGLKGYAEVSFRTLPIPFSK